MTAFPSYSTGTVAIGAGATSIVGTGSNWTGQNAVPGDTFTVPGKGSTKIVDVTSATALVIDAWPFGAITASAYSIKKDSPLRFAGGQAMADVSTLVGALNTDGFYVFVPPTATVPDPSYGNDGQFAFQASTGKLWQKSGGTWNFQGINKAFGVPAPWSAATAYNTFDVATLAGTSYVCILANTNQTPPNATYWSVLAGVGSTGETGATGTGYGGTSTTSLAIATGSKAFTTQAGLAYQVGTYVRAASASGGANFMEGFATAYSGTTLTINVTKIGGSGTKADWNFQVAGAPGTGDLLSTNNLSELTNKTTARTNLGSTTVGDALFTAASAAAARATLAIAPAKGYLFGLTLSAAGGTGTFGIAAGEAANSTGTDLMALASAYTKTTATWAVGTATGSLDTGAIAASTWYHVHQIKRPDTGVVDVLVSLSATAPTMPTNYTLFRRIGSMKTDGSKNWVKFTQLGDDFLWDVATQDFASTLTTTAALLTLNVPTGVQVDARFQGLYTGPTVNTVGLITSPDQADSAASLTNFSVLVIAASTSGPYDLRVRTNASGQIRGRAGAALTLWVNTYGWADTRGRLS